MRAFFYTKTLSSAIFNARREYSIRFIPTYHYTVPPPNILLQAYFAHSSLSSSYLSAELGNDCEEEENSPGW